MRAATFTLVLALTGCGPRAAEQIEPTPAIADPSDRTGRDEVDDAFEAAPEETPLQLTDRDLDAMERSDIEAACYAGSTAACDRLGH